MCWDSILHAAFLAEIFHLYKQKGTSRHDRSYNTGCVIVWSVAGIRRRLSAKEKGSAVCRHWGRVDKNSVYFSDGMDALPDRLCGIQRLFCGSLCGMACVPQKKTVYRVSVSGHYTADPWRSFLLYYGSGDGVGPGDFYEKRGGMYAGAGGNLHRVCCLFGNRILCPAIPGGEVRNGPHEEQIGLIPCAEGGSSIDEWKIDGTLFHHAVSEAKFALENSELIATL